MNKLDTTPMGMQISAAITEERIAINELIDSIAGIRHDTNMILDILIKILNKEVDLND